MDGILLALVALALACLALFFYSLAWMRRPLRLNRLLHNPVLAPNPESWWESQATFNPAAWYDGQTVHLLYRALGADGVSRIGYAMSRDGLHFERLPYPVYTPEETNIMRHRSYTSPARYDPALWASGGGWGGSEDPRMVAIEGRVHVTFNIFNGWYAMRVGLLSISEDDFKNKRWNWKFNFLSPPGRHKNWVLFPEKIAGRYGLFHNLEGGSPARVKIEYFNEVEVPDHLPHFESPDPHALPDRQLAWHNRTRSAGPPPIKTPYGWLLLYHAMDTKDPNRYKLGALLLDLNDPRKVLYRSAHPVLAPDAWYENDWKPGIIYVSGAVVVDGNLIVYYGGGDKYVAAAKAPLSEFIHKLMSGDHAVLEPVKIT